MILTHGANSLSRGGKETTQWTTDTVPAGTLTLHDGVPSIPTDSGSIDEKLISITVREAVFGFEDASINESIVSIEVVQ